MKAEYCREELLTEMNDLDPRLAPMSRCMNIGIGGGCGLRCPVFCEGECEEPQEFNKEDLLEEFNQEELEQLSNFYDCFKDLQYGKRK